VVLGLEGFGMICHGGEDVGGLSTKGCAASSFAIVLERRVRGVGGVVVTVGGNAAEALGDIM
jgi:hypothetical protein